MTCQRAAGRARIIDVVKVFRALVLFAVLASAGRADALDPTRTLSQYVHRIWQVQQGLPQATIYSIVQTHDGYLWLGTQTGLVKFDGERFTTVDELDGIPLKDVWITELIEDDQGTLWIGTNHAGLVKVQRGKARRFGQEDGLPVGTVQCLLADHHGNLWVCTPVGLAEVTRDKIRVLDMTVNVRAACVTPNGGVEVGADNNRLARWNGTDFESRSLAVPASTSTQALLCARDGALWIGTSNGLIRIANKTERRFSLADGLADNSVVTLTESRDGSILVGTKNGFSRIRADEVESFRPQDGLSQSTVYSVYEDREGSLWVATKHGLNQFFDGRGIPYTTNEGLPSNNTGPVLQDRAGRIWIGTLGGGLARYDGHRFTALTTSAGLASNSIDALAEDRDGSLWVGTSGGLNRLVDGRVVQTWKARDGLPDDAVRALFVDREGTLWIATSGGAAAFDHGRLHAVPRFDHHTEPILALGDDRAGRLYAVPGDSPALRHADAIFRDSEGLLWIGTLGDGLRLIDGDRVFTFSVTDGLFDDVIYGIAADDFGRLWMACSKGIFSVKRDDLRQLAAGKLSRIASQTFSPLDALRTIECQSGVQPVIAKTRDGRLWFSTIRGVLVLDPSRLERRFLPPSVAVEDVTIDGERRRLPDVGSLSAGTSNIEFGYTGVSFIAPNRLTFRYKLEGFDKTWIEAGSRRQAFYTNLPPGRFQFRLEACNPGNACSEAPAVVAFTIAPRLYQRAWFLPLLAAALALGGWGIYQLRIRRLREQFDLILAERGRIARELHDTLIQGFSGITMAMQAVVSRLPPSSRERRALEDIVADAGDSLQEARRSLAGLRTGHDAHSLAAALEETAREATAAKDMRLRLRLADLPRPLTADIEYNLLRIAQEAIANAANHSGARALTVSLASASSGLMLSIADDGAGFDASSPAPDGHYGVMGMKERAANIGAGLRVITAPGRGTTVEVILEP
jgi:ligand-binding sensor domain-containing protein/signal transduction histidine kinase